MKVLAFIQKNSNAILIGLLVVLAIGISIQKYTGTTVDPDAHWVEFKNTKYNNYLIFKASFQHLQEDVNLYQKFGYEHYDLYKYSPSFAAVMGLFHYLPDWLGLTLWNLLNLVVLGWGLVKLRLPKHPLFWLVVPIVLIEAVATTQNSQCNALIAGLAMIGVSFLERGGQHGTAISFGWTAFIKVFGAAFFSMLALYKDKVKSAGYSALWMVVTFAIPLLFISFDSLIDQYINWKELLETDHDASTGFSVLGVLNACFNIFPNKLALLAIGTLLLLGPLLRIQQHKAMKFRLMYLASLLLYVVIFNHKAESPTYVIAASGVLIWYLLNHNHWIDHVLLILVVLFTSLIQMGVWTFVADIATTNTYAIKAIPCILVWLRIQYGLIFEDHSHDSNVLTLKYDTAA